MESEKDSFKQIEEALDLNIQFVEELNILDIKSLTPESRDFLFSQLKKTIGILGNLITNGK